VLAISSLLFRLHLSSLIRRFSESVHKYAARTARLVTVLMENPSARHTEFSLGTIAVPWPRTHALKLGYSVAQTKLAASSVLPEPLYLAICG